MYLFSGPCEKKKNFHRAHLVELEKVPNESIILFFDVIRNNLKKMRK